MVNARGSGEGAVAMELPSRGRDGESSLSSSSEGGVGMRWAPSWMMMGGNKKKAGAKAATVVGAGDDDGMIQVVHDIGRVSKHQHQVIYYAKGSSSLSVMDDEGGIITHLHLQCQSRVSRHPTLGISYDKQWPFGSNFVLFFVCPRRI